MQNRIFEFISKHKSVLAYAQLFLSGIAIGFLTWDVLTYAKRLLLSGYHFNMNPWTSIFFRPYVGGFANYLFVCTCVGLCGLLVYLKTEFIKSKLEQINPYDLVSILILSVIIFAISGILSAKQHILAMSFVSLIPLTYLINFQSGAIRKSLFTASGILLTIISLEQFYVVKGPVYLLNEYQNIYSETYIEGKYVNNKDFLDKLGTSFHLDTMKSLFYSLTNRKDKHTKPQVIEDGDPIFQSDLKRTELETLQNYFAITSKNEDVSKWPELEKKSANIGVFVDNLKNIGMLSIIKFYINNNLEYMHQNMARGQINHIGCILNPMNEYSYGKPLKDIYMQYGLGNTFLIKWTMKLFGGLSLENYYKCYIYYIIYAALFLIMLYYLFQDSLYVLGVFAVFTFAYFWQGFIAFILGPGLLPTIHFFDVLTMILLLLFFRSDNKVYLGIAALFSMFGILMNQQFGFVLTVSVFVSLLLYAAENKEGKYKWLWMLSSAALLGMGIITIMLLSKINSFGVFKYYLLGFFSWRPHPVIILLTVCYLTASYAFLILLKDKRFYFKYIYLFVFIYTQGLFVYYYWSGLTNHLPTVMPFVGLQLFLMLFISQKLLFENSNAWSRISGIAARLAMVLAMLFMIGAGTGRFHAEKTTFRTNFVNHKVYHWQFDRANLISTINPKPIEEAVSLIHKYSKDDNPGIYIVSKYDNLLPFLAKRYSLMPYFEMTYFLFSDKELCAAVDKIDENKPDYIFVDTDIEQLGYDLWSKLYNSAWSKNERFSRFGRYLELQKLFEEVSDDYKKVVQGQLLSVYKRKQL